MKKKILLVLVSCLLMSGVFASGNYHPSISISDGFSLIDKSRTNHPTRNQELDGFSFDSDIQYWNLWDVTNKLQLGFVADLGCKIGTYTYAKMEGQHSVYTSNYFMGLFLDVGFAAAFQFNNVIKLQGAIGIGGGASPIDKKENVPYGQDGWDISYGLHGTGIFIELQAKFIPTKMFSPIVGYKFSNLITVSHASTAGVKYNYKTTQILNTIYAGCAFNFK